MAVSQTPLTISQPLIPVLNDIAREYGFENLLNPLVGAVIRNLYGEDPLEFFVA